VKTQYGWHIIKVDDVRDVKAPAMEEIKDQLKQMIAADQNWQKAKFSELMQKLRTKAKIQ
jgi:peptidyl-prolyl cis-trans isomerase C